MSIRTRVTGLMLMMVLAIVFISGSALYFSEKKALRVEAMSTRNKTADQLARACRDALKVGDELAALNAVQYVGQIPGVLQAYAVNVENRVVGHTVKGRLGRPPVEDSPSAERWRVVRPLGLARSKGKPDAQVVVDFSRSKLDQDVAAALRPAARRIAWVTVGASILGVIGAAFLAGSITRPIDRIAQATRALADGRLTHVIEPLGGDEVGALANDFNRMAARLGEVEKMKNAFVANVTHELRSPISAIESCARLIAEEVRAGDLAEVTDQLSSVRNNASRLGRFINNLLDLSKIDAGASGVEPERASAREALQEVAHLFHAKALEKNIALTLDVTDGLEVWADPDKLGQIITNLVGNALKFTPPGGRITLRGRADGAGIALSVADTGPGIRPEDQERIFDRFEQVREARDQVNGPKGTGLGLAIARGLAQAHGGRLSVRSVYGQGSEFILWLPKEDENA